MPDPKTWATGGEPATEKQKAFLNTLKIEKGIDVDESQLNKGEASKQIEKMKATPATENSGSSQPTKPVRHAC